MIRLIGVVVLLIVQLSSCATVEIDDFKDQYLEVLGEGIVKNPAEPSGKEGPSQEKLGEEDTLEISALNNAVLVDMPRFDIAVENTGLSIFLNGLAIDTPINIIVHPSVKTKVTLELKQVSLIDVLKIVRDMFDLHLEVSGNLVKIMPDTIKTSIYTLDYVNLSRRGVSDMSVSTGSIKDSGSSGNGNNSNNSNGANNNSSSANQSQSSEVIGSRVSTENSTDMWKNLTLAIKSLVGSGDGRRVTVMEQSGTIIVRALRSELKIVGDFLKVSELSLQRQVILEAKILEVVLDDGFERGIEWQALDNINGAKGGPLEYGLQGNRVQNPSGLSGVFSTKAVLKDFGAIIELLETQGSVRVLSSPRIATINNQKAVIKVGTDEFFVTNVSSTTTTGTSTTTTPSVTLTPFFSGIALDVTPQISDSGEVILHIHPTVSEVSDQNKVVTIGDDTVNLPLALSTIRESDSIVKAKNGQIIVIGGLLKNVTRDTRSGIPLLSRIPFIRAGFSQHRRGTQRSELVILVRPIVSDEESQYQDVLDSLQRLSGLGGR